MVFIYCYFEYGGGIYLYFTSMFGKRKLQWFEITLREKCQNTEFFLVRIQSRCGKIQTRKTPYFDTFHAV